MNKNVIYKNHLGVELNLTDAPYHLQVDNLFDWTWNFDLRDIGNRASQVMRFYRNSSEYDIDLVITADNDDEMYEAMEQFNLVTGRDVHDNQAGKLILDDGTYLICYVVEAQNSGWSHGVGTNVKTIKILSIYPFWTKETTKKFFSEDTADGDPDAKGYEYNYEYNYVATGQNTSIITNDSISSADFVLTINGSASNPIIIDIGVNRYQLNMELGSNEYVVIDSRLKTITLTNAVGEKENVFNNRSIDSYIFEKIPRGNNVITWTGDFIFELTLFNERSEPTWTT